MANRGRPARQEVPGQGVHYVEQMDEESPDAPRYELTSPAYHNDVFYNVGDEMVFMGVPGDHMIPLNAAAHEMAKKRVPMMDPILGLSVIQ